MFTATLHIGGHSSIHNLRMRHAVVTDTHLRWIIFYTVENYLTGVSLNSAWSTVVLYHILCTHALQNKNSYHIHIQNTKFVFLQLFNPLNAELNPICHLPAILGVHFLHISRITVKSLTLRLLMSYIYIYIYIYIYWARIPDVSRSHTTHHSR